MTQAQRWTMVATILGTSMVFLEGTIVNLALPHIGRELTATLMSSIPTDNAATGSAINNAISRVGQPLLSAVIFVAITGSFYTTLAGAVPGADASDPALRAMVQTLNAPHAGTPDAVAGPARDASVDSFHLAVIVCGTLLVLGAATNGIGLRVRPDEMTATVPREATSG